MASTAAATAAGVRKAYRDLLHVIRQMPAVQRGDRLRELRAGFRRPLAADETAEGRLRRAVDRAAFLRITTVKTKPRGESGTWVYKDGQRLDAGDGTAATPRDANGKVVSNWDGKNLDPCSVKRHRQSLNRAGFVNNAHAKGFF